MSRYHNAEIICPVCKKKNIVRVWDSVNVDINPEIKEDILSGKFNHSICPSCNVEINCVYGFLYHDMKHRYMVGIEHDYTTALLMTDCPDGYRFRRVKDINGLIEKINIFELELNDIVIEMVKKIVMETSNRYSKLLFCTIENNNMIFMFADQPAKGIFIPIRIYDFALKKCSKADLDEKPEFMIVDQDTN
ncbi:CpXC domain-containing protein [Lacrimispora amygdalina]|uniref:CpXC domain-containing protein n=1 Tax=Lacrimispora amygdalina TaxID=253257 RepID=UPI000BE30B4B|nr:CpXC domain-containing protein [Lacrimispora amygdalina]